MKKHERFFPTTDDFRDPYSRDRDRVVHSKSFRVLEYKTQVFINTDGDYFRTRLTHSIEVSQIARTISKHLGLDQSLSEAIALAHDLGHTPFGHIGGDELHKVLKAHGSEAGFDHNYQSFRVVTELEHRYSEYRGLNLTFATLEGILKHSAPYDKGFIPGSVREVFHMDLHPSLEAAVVDQSDEIAYISHDIDDGIQHGLIDVETLKESELIRELTDSIRDREMDERSEQYRYKLVSLLISTLISDLIEHSSVVSGPIPATEPMPIRFSAPMRTKLSRLKKLLFTKLYRHQEVVKKMYTGRVCIDRLFAAFHDEPQTLPENYQERIRRFGKKERVIADFIASLSDRHALELYRELYFGM